MAAYRPRERSISCECVGCWTTGQAMAGHATRSSTAIALLCCAASLAATFCGESPEATAEALLPEHCPLAQITAISRIQIDMSLHALPDLGVPGLRRKHQMSDQI